MHVCLDELVGLEVFLNSLGSDAVAKVTKGLKLLSLVLKHSEDGFHGLLEHVVLHLGLKGPRGTGEDGTSSEPHLVRLGTISDKGQLGHVGTGAAVGAASHADKDLLVVNVELGHDRSQSLDVAGHDALGLGLGKAAEGKGRAGHGQTGEGVDFFDGFDSVLGKDLLEPSPILGLNVLEQNGLGGAHDHGKVVLVDDGSEARLESEVTLVLDATVVNVKSVEEVAISLFPPAHPITVLPRFDLFPWLDLFSEVGLDQRFEAIDSESVHQVLHAGVGTNVSVSVVALGGEDRLEALHDVLLRDESHVVGSTSKGRLLVVGSSHSTTDHDVETQKFVVVIHDDNATDIVRVDVQRVVARNGNSDLKLAGEVSVSVERFLRMVEDDTPSRVVGHSLVNVVVFNFFSPELGGSDLFSVQPELRKGGSHGTEEVGKDLGVFADILVVLRDEGGRGRHNVTVDVSTGTDGGRTNVHDRGNHGLEGALHDSVKLEALASGSSEVALSVVGGEVVEQPVEVRGEFSCGLLETEHELVILHLSAFFTVGLLVGSVVLHDLVSVLGDADAFGL